MHGGVKRSTVGLIEKGGVTWCQISIVLVFFGILLTFHEVSNGSKKKFNV